MQAKNATGDSGAMYQLNALHRLCLSQAGYQVDLSQNKSYDKSENQRKDTMNIIERWESCESIDEAKKLLDYIVSTPSKDWLPLMSKAEHGEVL